MVVRWRDAALRAAPAFVLITPANPVFQTALSNGSELEIALRGSGEALIDIENGEVLSVDITGTDDRTSLSLTARGECDARIGSLASTELRDLTISGVVFDSPAELDAVRRLFVGSNDGVLAVHAAAIDDLRLDGAARVEIYAASNVSRVTVREDLVGSVLAFDGTIERFTASGSIRESTVAASRDINRMTIRDDLEDALILAGTRLLSGADTLATAEPRAARIVNMSVSGDAIDSVIAAGGDPGSDGLFEDGDVLPRSVIERLTIRGVLEGVSSPHPNPGIYAGTIERLSIDRSNIDMDGDYATGVLGSAIVDPLPAAGTALDVNDIEAVIERAVAQARDLGVNATIALLDREGNILAAVRMTEAGLTPAPLNVTVSGGGAGGIEGVVVPSGVIASTKAGTATFLSTEGNAFTTRTAAFIIQPNFPGGINNQPSGPLYGVQLSSLPTSDINRLPLGLSGDPGGVPLYRNGAVVGGIGVEVDGLYTAPDSRAGRSQQTDEERIALAGQIGFEPPDAIGAENVFVNGIRFASNVGRAPRLNQLGAIPDYDDLVAGGQLNELVAPRVSPPTFFETVALDGRLGETLTGFQDGAVEAFTLFGGTAYTVQVTRDLERELVAVNTTTGVETVLENISDGGPLDLLPESAVTGMAYLDQQTASTADDTILLFTSDESRVLTFSLAAGDIAASGTLPGATPAIRAPVSTVIGGASFVIGIDVETGRVLRVNPASLGAAGSYVFLSAAANGPIQSLAVTLDDPPTVFAVAENGDDRELLSINPTNAAVTSVETLTDGDANEPPRRVDLLALAIETNGTASTADDSLIAQATSLGAQLRITFAGVVTSTTDLANADGALTSALQGTIGADRVTVGVSKLTGQLTSVATGAPGNDASIDQLTTQTPGVLARAGVARNGQNLTTDNVELILEQAHELNRRLRAQIRRDRPQRSQVSVSVVDTEGNLLGTFRTPDAPVFGFDVSVQKARTAAFFSSNGAGAALAAADAGMHAGFVNRANAFGVALDGSVAMADRTGGFLSRPFFPDGITSRDPGPFAPPTAADASAFNTGLQTSLIVVNLVDFLLDVTAIGDEGRALDLFDRGLIGGGAVADPSLPVQNGIQIFPGSVPLYKNGVLVGGIGVSGDGIEQDDFISFIGATGFQDFPANVRRADEVVVQPGVRLPYVKFPRSPFGNL
ncbi:MAG: heme-binding protein [Phycisphaerales bacterium]